MRKLFFVPDQRSCRTANYFVSPFLIHAAN